MVDILMMILVGVAGLLALVLAVFFCPFGVLFWLVLVKNAEAAPPLVADSFYEEFERQLAILEGKPDPLLGTPARGSKRDSKSPWARWIVWAGGA